MLLVNHAFALVTPAIFVVLQQLKKRGLWEGVVQEPLHRALFSVFLCSEVIFSCKSHRNIFQKAPLQCRHFLENPLAKNPKTQLLSFVGVRGATPLFLVGRIQIRHFVVFIDMPSFFWQGTKARFAKSTGFCDPEKRVQNAPSGITSEEYDPTMTMGH